MSASITLPVDFARELLEWGPGDGDDGWTVVAIEEGGSGRWTCRTRLIVQRDADGQLFDSWFREGLTESQECQPWDGEQTVTFEPVERRTRLVEVVEYVAPTSAGQDQTDADTPAAGGEA